jgi:hypothetical protein
VSVILQVVCPRLLGPAVMVAAAIIVKGYGDVGDGFSAGVVVALAVGGLLFALAIGFSPVILGEPPLTHYPRAGGHVVEIGTLELTTAMAFDVGVFLLVAGALVELIHQLARLIQEPRT